jgi:Mrp family chromosome partitioning ATPase/capsular polysaccharide biosynthesis protein
MTSAAGSDHSVLRQYLGVVRRRKWIALAAIVLVPVAAIAFSQRQQALYQASARVLLSTQNLAAELTGTQTSGINLTPDRIAQTQGDIARVSGVASGALQRVPGTGLTPAGLLARSIVSPSASADVLTFRVTDHDPKLAARLVNAYAGSYVAYRHHLDTQAIKNALDGVNAKIQELLLHGDATSALYSSLLDRQQTLETMEALQTSNASVIQSATKAGQTQPRTARNAILGLILGIMLGIGLAFLYEALDTRVRSADDVSRRLDVPLLARIPAPPRSLRSDDRLVMVAEPRSQKAEPFRVLRTNLEYVSIESRPRTIAVTSALEGEGKSTTAANLAVALVRAGHDTVLVDLDLRRPYLDRFFGLDGRPTLMDVALGRVPLEKALVPFVFGGSKYHPPAANGNGGGGSMRPTGRLEVLAAGPAPPNPGEFAGSQIVAGILSALAERASYVIIDTAPLLGVGDTLSLTRSVDAMVLVTRLNKLRKPMLGELARLLDGAPVDVLGFVVTDAEAEEHYGLGYYGYGYAHTRERAVQGEEALHRTVTAEGDR